MKPIMIEIGFGELLDRISILETKSRKIAEPGKLRFIAQELGSLKGIMYELEPKTPKELVELRKVNEDLWKAVDGVEELLSAVNESWFCDAAREVVRLNRLRAGIKRAADARVGSIPSEQKA